MNRDTQRPPHLARAADETNDPDSFIQHLTALALLTSSFHEGVVEQPTCAEAAVELAARGFEVLPIRPRSKVPATPNGLHDASDDPRRVAEGFATRYQHCGVAVRVPEGLIVLDTDPRNGSDDTLAQLEREHGPLPATLTVESGRGDGGRHRYYRHPGGPLTSRRLGPGLDLKTHSGYVLVPPTRHPDTGEPYAWADLRPPAAAPTWLTALLRHPPTSTRPLLPRPRIGGTAALSGLVEYVERLAPGNRNAGLFWAACRAVEDAHDVVHADAALHALSEATTRMTDPLPEVEVRRTLASARTRGAA